MSTLYSVQELLVLSTQYLEQQGCASPRLDAELLLGHVLDLDRVHVYLNLARPLEIEEVDAYRRLIGLRGRRVPVAYLTGTKEFYAKEFKVTKDVLIPRPETEILVDQAVELAQQFSTPKVLDLGTGSGVIAITIAALCPAAQVLAVDISEDALKVAHENADHLGVADQLSFLHSDLFSQVPKEKYDVICSNPPYIPKADLARLEQEVLQEPQLALDGGDDGLDFYCQIIAIAPGYLAQGGYLIVEIGYDQAAAVLRLAQEHGFTGGQVIKDYAGHDRVVVWQWC